MCEEDERLMQEAIDQIRKLLNPKPEDDNFGYRDLRTSFEKVVGEIACMFYLDGDRKMERIIIFDPERVKLADVTRLQDSTPSIDWEDQVIFNSEGSFEFVELDKEQAKEVDDWLNEQEIEGMRDIEYEVKALAASFNEVLEFYKHDYDYDKGLLRASHMTFKEWTSVRNFTDIGGDNYKHHFNPERINRRWGRRG